MGNRIVIVSGRRKVCGSNAHGDSGDMLAPGVDHESTCGRQDRKRHRPDRSTGAECRHVLAGPRSPHHLRRSPGGRGGAFDRFQSVVQAGTGELQDRRACPSGRRRLGYRTGQMERAVSDEVPDAGLVVADIANPVFFGIIRGAERRPRLAASRCSCSRPRNPVDRTGRGGPAASRLVDGAILSSSRMVPRSAVAKRMPIVLLNRIGGRGRLGRHRQRERDQEGHRASDRDGIPRSAISRDPRPPGPSGARWRGLREAGLELDLHVRRVGPFLPTIRGGAQAAEEWLLKPSTGVIANNDLMAIGFIQAMAASGRSVPGDVSVSASTTSSTRCSWNPISPPSRRRW